MPGVQVYIGATTADLQKGLEDAKRAMEGFRRDAVAGMRGAAAGTEEASRGIGEKLREIAREERAGARTARFFVTEFAEIVPISNEAKGALSRFGGSLIGGGPWAIGIGVAVAGIALLTKHFIEQKKAAEEAAEASAKSAGEMAHAIMAADASTRAFYEKFRDYAKTDEEKFVAGATAPLRSKLDEINAAIAVKEIEHDTLKARGGDEKELAKLKEQINAQYDLAGAIRIRLDEERAVAAAAFPLLDAEKTKHEAIKKAIEEKAKIQENLAKIIPEWQAETNKLYADEALRVAEASAKLGKVIAEWQAETNKLYAEDELRRAKAQAAASEHFHKSLKASQEQVYGLEGNLQSMAGVAGQAFNVLITGGDLSGKAFLRMARDAIAAKASEAMVNAAYYSAMALAFAAMENYKSAGEAAGAAAGYASVAALAGAASYAMSASLGPESSGRSSSAGGGSSGSGVAGATPYSGGGTVRETVYIIGPAGMTEAELARITARALDNAKRLDMIARES